MNRETKKNLSTKQAEDIYKAFERSMYWIDVMVKNNDINKAQAGCLINKGVKNGHIII